LMGREPWKELLTKPSTTVTQRTTNKSTFTKRLGNKV